MSRDSRFRPRYDTPEWHAFTRWIKVLPIGLVFLIPLFACGQIFNAIVFPQIQRAIVRLAPNRQAENQQKLDTIIKEAGVLPLYPYGTELSRSTSSGEGSHGAYVEVLYHVSTSCTEAQDYYARALPAANWAAVDHSDVSSISRNYVLKFYQKTVDNRQVELYVGCYESNAQYVTHIEAV
jgi:hypothetical protein